MTTTTEPVNAPDAPRGKRRRKGRRSRVLTILGLVLILTGLGFLAYVAWEYYGTNIVSKNKQENIKEQITEDWGQNLDSDALGLLRIERFGTDYEVPLTRGWSDEALSSGVGWYEDGVGPGEIGNFVIAGHRVTRGEPFRKFTDLQIGDRIEVETRTHVYTYEMRTAGDDIRVDFSAGWPMFPVPDPDERGAQPTEELITLVTCAELFHTDDRLVAIGALVDTVEKTPTPSTSPT